MTDKIRVSTYITEEAEKYLRIAAAVNRTSMSKYIEWLIVKDMVDVKSDIRENPNARTAGKMDKELLREITKEKSLDD